MLLSMLFLELIFVTDKEIYDSIVAEGLDPSGISVDDLRRYVLMLKNHEMENMFFSFSEKERFLNWLRDGLSASEMISSFLGGR